MTNEDKNRKRPLIEEMSQESQGGSSAGHADGGSTPELFSMPPPTATWADSKDSEQPDSEVSVPALSSSWKIMVCLLHSSRGTLVRKATR